MERSLRLGSRFFKGHGHGNDYIVFEEGDMWPVTAESVQLACHRSRGIGADGIVVLLASPGLDGTGGWDGARDSERLFRLRMFNPDGSEFERSGNGLRILAAFLESEGEARLKVPFRVEVGGEVVTMEILSRQEGGLLDVSVAMGQARFGPESVGSSSKSFLSIGPELRSGDRGAGWAVESPSGTPLQVHPVSVGNPHCVVFRSGPLEQDLLELGPYLTEHPAFPVGTNVQIGRVLSSEEIEILIWERGVGRTSSSGTSACAAAAAGVQAGYLKPGPIRVGMEGGSFTVTVSPELSVTLQGPVQPLLVGELTEGLLASLRS
jgi:diaminopimelate epimerase